MKSLEKLGRDFKMRRTDEGITQRELSNISNVSILTIQKIENGKGNVTLGTLSKISKALDSLIEVNIKQQDNGK